MIDQKKVETLVNDLIEIIRKSETCIHEDFIAIRIVLQHIERKIAMAAMDAILEDLKTNKTEGIKVDEDIVDMLKGIMPKEGEAGDEKKTG